jgi:sporulation protein YlmC with PRC-barrel domain
MSTVRQSSRAVLVLSLIGVLSGYAWAAGRSDIPRSSGEFNTNQNQMSRHDLNTQGSDVALQRASKLIGSNVKSSDGKNLGTIYDIVLTPDLNSVSYIALSRDGAFGLNRALYAVPWSALKMGVGNTYYLPITVSHLEATEGFKEAYWPSSPARGWITADATKEGTEPIYQGTTREQSRDVQNRRVSKIIGINVKDTHGTMSGDVKDMVIAGDSGQVVYTIVSYGGTFGLGARYAAVPAAAIDIQPRRGVAVLRTDRNTLVAGSFSPMQWPDLSSPAFEQRIAALYGTQPSGAVFGYVPPEGNMKTEPKAKTHEPAKEYEGSALGYQPPMDTSEALTFDPANVRTIEGTVIDVGKSGAGAPGSNLLALRLKTADDKIVTVNLGPRDYISKQNFYVVNGDRITVTGSELTVGERPTFLATEIRSDGQILRLRNPSGHPLWLEPAPSHVNESEGMGYVPPESSADVSRTPEHVQKCPMH